MRITEYQFNRLVCNNASEKDIAKLFNISLEEATDIIKNDLKAIYDGIKKVYNTSENIDTIISEFKAIEEKNNIENIKISIKEFQENKEVKLSAEEFVEALQFCKIRVPKACYTKLNYVRGDKLASLNTGSAKVWDTIFNAIDKLNNYNLVL